MSRSGSRPGSGPGSGPGTLGREAIVVGGGIGGLAAARALSDHFERVTVLERDAPAEAHASRAGVPQGKHLHALLAGGQRALDALLPGFTEDLDRVGAVRIQTGLDLLVERPGFDPFPRRDLGFYSSALSRPQLEFCVRRRVEAIENVRVEPGCRVFGLLPSDDGAAIRGLQFHREGRSETRATDLVIDASGTGELTLAALRATGRAAAPETVIGVDLGYSSAVFEIPSGASPGWKGVMHLSQAPQTSRSGLMLPVEGHRWMLALGGRHDEHPPGDEAGLRAYAASLRTSTIADAIGPARMVAGVAATGGWGRRGGPSSRRWPRSSRRHGRSRWCPISSFPARRASAQPTSRGASSSARPSPARRRGTRTSTSSRARCSICSGRAAP